MKINVDILTEPIEPTDYPMVCVSKHKYSDVHLCLSLTNGNVMFADISMNNGTYVDKSNQFEALTDLGEKIAADWNEKYQK